MLVKVSEAVGPALDWMVAKVMGTLGVKPRRCYDCKYHEERAGRDDPLYYCHHPKAEHETDFGWGGAISPDYGVHPACPISILTPEHYSTDWDQGGPIIEMLRAESKNKFLVESDGDNVHILSWVSEHVYNSGYGPTILIAAMRCFVASKLGDEVEVPDELC